jgi:hypothetical protein
VELLSGLLSSLGLSGAAGLNAYIPLLVVGLLARSGVMDLSAPFDLLANPWVLLGAAWSACSTSWATRFPAWITCCIWWAAW